MLSLSRSHIKQGKAYRRNYRYINRLGKLISKLCHLDISQVDLNSMLRIKHSLYRYMLHTDISIYNLAVILRILNHIHNQYHLLSRNLSP